MPSITFGSNISSLQGQRQLSLASRSLSTSLERLSTGQRINRASDDAAGLAISLSLSVDHRVAVKSISNINDKISLLNVAEGALQTLSNVTVRLKELTIQAANGILSNEQRAALNEEAQQLTQEYSRIIETTEFNGIKLFDTSLGEVSVDLTKVAGTEDVLSEPDIPDDGGTDEEEIVSPGNGVARLPRSDEPLDPALVKRKNVGENGALPADLDTDGSVDTIFIPTHIQSVGGVPSQSKGLGGGVPEGNEIGLLLASTKAIAALPQLSLLTQEDATQALATIEETFSGLESALSTIDSARDTIFSELSSNGTSQRRLGVRKGFLEARDENILAALSRILDADIGAEASNVVRLQILQNAGAAVLAQANQQPALGLRLLTS